MDSPLPAAPAPAPAPAAAAAATVGNPEFVSGPSLVLQAWSRVRREPTVLLTVAYLSVSFVGLWASFWFYRGFGLPILEYMQPSDYLVAGLRDPVYGLLLVLCVAFSALISWPETYRRRHPERVAAWRQRWWGRLVFPQSRLFRWKLLGVTPETGIALATAWAMIWASANYVHERGEQIRAGHGGARIEVARGEGRPARPARLLGSTSSFVFVWWPDARVAEAIPIGTVQGLVSHPANQQAAPAAAPVSTAVPAAAAGAGGAATVDARPAR